MYTKDGFLPQISTLLCHAVAQQFVYLVLLSDFHRNHLVVAIEPDRPRTAKILNLIKSCMSATTFLIANLQDYGQKCMAIMLAYVLQNSTTICQLNP